MAKRDYQSLYEDYRRAYHKQSEKTPMEDMLDKRDFVLQYKSEIEEARRRSNSPSDVISQIVRGQRDILTRKQVDALYRNAPRIFELYQGAELKEFFEQTGWLLLQNPEERYLWGERYGSIFKNQLILWETENWESYFNS